jgi:hypothetical protein
MKETLWEMWKKNFDAWEDATHRYVEPLLKSPVFLRPAALALAGATRTKSAVDRVVTAAVGSLGVATKRDQERVLHLLNRLETRLMDMEERLAEPGSYHAAGSIAAEWADAEPAEVALPTTEALPADAPAPRVEPPQLDAPPVRVPVPVPVRVPEVAQVLVPQPSGREVAQPQHASKKRSKRNRRK